MKKRFFCITLVFALFGALPAQACTLWAANGSFAQASGSMIVKNRDWTPDQYQYLKTVYSNDGYSYLGLYAQGSPAGLKAGINEQGLVVVSATAGSIPASERNTMPNRAGSLTKLLRECASVDEALSKTELFVGPKILMLADKNKIAMLEIGPDGIFSAHSEENSVIYHTNHYVFEDMLNFNYKIGVSSRKRYDRIGELLGSLNKPYDFDTFVSLSNDQNDGPDNSIFRIGSTPEKTRTMAVWAVLIPFEGSPELYVRILNPGEEEKVISIKADDIFAADGNEVNS